MAKNPALTSSYKAPKSAKKIPKGDTGFKIVDKAFKAENEAETSSYIPPQSPIAIQPGDKGFEIVGKAYNKWLWTFPEWKNKKSKIINPAANWNMNAKPMTPAQIKKKMKTLYLKEEYISGGLSSGMTLKDIAKHHDKKGYYHTTNMIQSLAKELRLGINVEMEHTGNREIAKEIAMDHLYEDPSYYTKLNKMEEKEIKTVNEKSVSAAQQAVMGQAWALRKGEISLGQIDPKYRKEIKAIADGEMTDKELKKFASTKSKNLPEYVKDGKPVKEGAEFDEDYLEEKGIAMAGATSPIITSKSVPGFSTGINPGGGIKPVVPYLNPEVKEPKVKKKNLQHLSDYRNWIKGKK